MLTKYVLQSIRYKTLAFWIFTPQKSNTFVEIIQNIIGMARIWTHNQQSKVNRANHYTIEASYKKGHIFHVEFYNVLLFGQVKIQNVRLL